MIVVDTSALLAIALEEPEGHSFMGVIRAADRVMISAVSLLEAGMVMRGRGGPKGMQELMIVLKGMDLEIIAFDEALATAALAAFDVYGKGIHSRARLNMGDCAAYALAKSRGAPLLFKGDDFTATDIARRRLTSGPDPNRRVAPRFVRQSTNGVGEATPPGETDIANTIPGRAERRGPC